MNLKNTDCTLLVVDDNPDDVFLLKRALKAAAVENPLQVVADGRAAVSYLNGEGPYANREKYPYPSLVFLDLKLPYLSGLKVLEWWRSQNSLPSTVIIVLSSSHEPADLTTAYRLGASSYLIKPPTTEELVSLATAIRAYWLQYNAFPRSPAATPAPSNAA
jgi:CheY-like chemotaxis protein